MNEIFKPVLRRFILIFFDDILIFSSSFTSHLQHFPHVLDTLQSHQFFLKRSKCQFGVAGVAYLGHVISTNGVSDNPKKIKTIKDWPLLINVWQLGGVLGVLGYYMRFIARYAQVVAPLFQLLKKDAFI